MAKLIISSLARLDIALTVSWSEQIFGPSASARYEVLLFQAMEDVAERPDRSGVYGIESRPELKTYRLYFSRNRVSSEQGRVRRPRHLLLFRPQADVVEVLRILHEAMDLERHLPPLDDQ